MRYLMILALLFTLPSPTVFAQYSLDTGREIAILGTAGALTGAEYLLFNEFDNLSEDQIKSFQSSQPSIGLKLDHWATKQSSKTAKTISDIFLRTSIVPPLIMIFDRPSANDVRKTQSIMTLETMAIATSFTNITKKIAKRPRPFMYNDDLFKFPMEMRRSKNARMSFFSGHTSFTAAMYFFTATTFSQYYPDSSWKPVVWTTAVSIPALTGFLRVKAGKHFPTDVAIGYAVGALVGGVLIPALH